LYGVTRLLQAEQRGFDRFSLKGGVCHGSI
jgi:hypothetical protein